jgi:hypothetical protein
MKTSKKWLGVLAAVFGCAAPALGGDLLQTPLGQSQATSAPVGQTQVYTAPVGQTPLVQPTGATSRWDEPAAPATISAPATQSLAPAACGQVPCENCDECCGPRFQFIASVEGTFFWPQFSRNFLTNTLTNSLGTETSVSNTVNGGVEGRLLAAPRITAGIQGECWGLVGRYWYANVGNSAFAPSIPGDDLYGITGFETFRAYTVDLEAQRRFCWCNWDMYGFGGVRYASLNDDRFLATTNSFGGPSLTAVSFAGQQFNGTGLTWGFMGTRPIWCDDSPWKLFFANRYSTLWGNGAVAAQTKAIASNTSGTATSLDGAAAGANGDLFIAEVQLGLQWECCCSCLPGRAFVRTAIEYQYWDTNYQASAQAFSAAALVPGGEAASAFAAADNMRFSLVGLTIGAGLMY